MSPTQPTIIGPSGDKDCDNAKLSTSLAPFKQGLLTHGLHRFLSDDGREQSGARYRLHFFLAFEERVARFAYNAELSTITQTEGFQLYLPPPSRTCAATIHIQSTAKGDRSCSASYVSTLASNTGKNVEHP